ncbi:RNA-directed DNA polymerase, eukaryota, reverse transcriptase zinc-binding domain protein [Tanacetum coccineum]|uniref:RNA-directed DNA polymerase, eukaryota, reverse transcriptase zinc-binding domain protein n=1 Tax=Tanacetum coccineum TaxID=301880 RepID=A0ABQ5J4N5_9ASTR
MLTKTCSSKRLVRLPVKYNDHVMMNSNQNLDQNGYCENDNCSGDDKMRNEDLGKECEENVSPMLNKGVFGSKEKDNSMGSEMNECDENVREISESIQKESICEKRMENVCNEEGIKETMPNKTYASAVQKNKQSIDTSLNFRPTVTDDKGCEFFIFDEELVSQVDDNGGCFFKFKNKEGMERVFEQGPWINVPPKAWTRDGISALASSLGKPLRMDNITVQTCQVGRGRAEFARVLVEFDVKKGFKDEIGIQYMSKDNKVKGTKVCSKMKKTNGEEVNNNNGKNANNASNKEDDGFLEVRHRKYDNWKNNRNYVHNQKKGEFMNAKKNRRNKNGIYLRKKNVSQNQQEQQGDKVAYNKGQKNKTKESRSWIIQDEIMSAIEKSNNKYVVLEEEEINKSTKLKQLKDRMIVDHYLNEKIQPTCFESQNCSKDMIDYFKQKWEEDRLKEKEDQREDIEDVMECENMCARMCPANEISRVETVVLH